MRGEVVSVFILPRQEKQALAQLLYKHDGILPPGESDVAIEGLLQQAKADPSTRISSAQQ